VQEPQSVTIVQIVPEQAAVEVGMVDVALAAFGVTGIIMTAALVAGLLAGAGYIWYRSRRAVTMIEARGNDHNYFRA
jgi:hypothetical protein